MIMRWLGKRNAVLLFLEPHSPPFPPWQLDYIGSRGRSTVDLPCNY